MIFNFSFQLNIKMTLSCLNFFFSKTFQLKRFFFLAQCFTLKKRKKGFLCVYKSAFTQYLLTVAAKHAKTNSKWSTYLTS